MTCSDNNENIDLGLGDGLKPGSLSMPPTQSHTSFSGKLSEDIHKESLSDSEAATAENSHTSIRLLSRMQKKLHNSKSRTKTSTPLNYIQKKASISLTYESSTPQIPVTGKMNGTSDITALDENSLKKKLKETEEEVESLKQELELCEKQLDAKYKAIKILQRHLSEESHKLAEKDKKDLQKQLNALQFDMDYQESCFVNSQDVWTNRFDRVCAENINLMRTLKEKNEEIKHLHAEKTALTRERDELLALTEVNDRQRYAFLKGDRSPDQHSGVASHHCASIELAVLGACHCRKQQAEPCACARAAASHVQRIAQLATQVEEQEKKLQESSLLADTYRRAFEEQLSQNRDLIGRLGQLTVVTPSKAEKAKNIVKWLIKQLNEDGPSHRRYYTDESIVPRRSRVANDNNNQPAPSLGAPSPAGSAYDTDIEQLFDEVRETPPTVGLEGGNVLEGGRAARERVRGVDLEAQTEQQIFQILADLVSDKTEALFHSRLATRLLAQKNKELTLKLQSEGDQCCHGDSAKTQGVTEEGDRSPQAEGEWRTGEGGQKQAEDEVYYSS